MEDENIQEAALQRRRKVPFSKEETLLILRAYELHPSSWTNVLADIKGNIQQLSNNHQMLYRSATAKQLKDRVSNKFGRLLHSNIDAIEDADIRTHVQRVRDLERRLVPPPPDDNVRQQNDQRELLLQQMSDSDDNQVEGGNRAPLLANAQRRQGHDGDNNAADGAQPLQQRDAAANNAALDQAQQPVQVLPNAAAGQINMPAQQDLVNAAAGQLNRPAQQPVQAGVNAAAGQHNRPAHRRRNRRSLSDQIRENQALYRRFLTKKVPKILRELGVSSDSSDENYV